MHSPKNSAKHYELLLKYENRHVLIVVEDQLSQDVERLAVMSLILFLHLGFKMRVMEMVLKERIVSLEAVIKLVIGKVEEIFKMVILIIIEVMVVILEAI